MAWGDLGLPWQVSSRPEVCSPHIARCHPPLAGEPRTGLLADHSGNTPSDKTFNSDIVPNIRNLPDLKMLKEVILKKADC